MQERDDFAILNGGGWVVSQKLERDDFELLNGGRWVVVTLQADEAYKKIPGV